MPGDSFPLFSTVIPSLFPGKNQDFRYFLSFFHSIPDPTNTTKNIYNYYHYQEAASPLHAQERNVEACIFGFRRMK